MIALAHGVTLKASGKMKWTANVNVHDIKSEDSSVYSLSIEADSESDAARDAARSVAHAMFGAAGEASFINQTAKPGVYMATIGVYIGQGVTRGPSAEILVREYHGVY
jgi:hypothetical protein